MTRFRFIVVSIAMLMGVGPISYAHDADNNTRFGTWMVTVTPPSESGRPAFNSLITFAGGGAFIASTQNDHAVPSAGIQQGTWRRTGNGQITSTELYFVYSPTGVAVGTVKVRATYEFIDANNLTGRGQLLRCDLSGSNCVPLPDCASIQGTRVEVEEPLCP
jgi:hypothetical protein